MLERSPKEADKFGLYNLLGNSKSNKVEWTCSRCGTPAQRDNWGCQLKPLESLQGLVLPCAGVLEGIFTGRHRLCSCLSKTISWVYRKKLNINQRKDLISEYHPNRQIEMSSSYRLTQHLVLARWELATAWVPRDGVTTNCLNLPLNKGSRNELGNYWWWLWTWSTCKDSFCEGRRQRKEFLRQYRFKAFWFYFTKRPPRVRRHYKPNWYKKKIFKKFVKDHIEYSWKCL